MAKPRARKLKVFRTAIGFHDAYVAAPSRAAALRAWGTGVNLFASGAAEEVSDAGLMREPLERPGEVIKRLRGSEAEQIKALGAGRAKAAPKAAKPAPPRKRGPKPSRAAVDKAEAALARAEQKQDAALAALKAEEAALAERRRKGEAAARDERARLEARIEQAREDYSAAMAKWAED